MEILVAVLAGGGVSGVMMILQACMQRHWAKKDRKDERIDALVNAQKVTMIDRVKYLGKRYLEEGWVSFDDKDNLNEMYVAYKKLGGNGHLDQIMHEVDKLKVIK